MVEYCATIASSVLKLEFDVNKTDIATPKVVSREQWLEERKALLEQEKQLTRERDRVAAVRRRLPMVKVEKDYKFDGPDGASNLLGLFGDSRQLIVYHFMFDPAWEKGCENCAVWAAEKSPALQKNLTDNGTRLVLVSRAPYSKIKKQKDAEDWNIPWFSSYGSDFNFDYHVSFDESIAPIEYNYRSLPEHEEAGTFYYFKDRPQPYELHGLSTFIQHEGNVFHTYSTFARGCEDAGGFHYLLDMTAYGRQQKWEDSPAGWPQQPLPYKG